MLYPCRKQCSLNLNLKVTFILFYAVSVQKTMPIKFKLKDNFFDDFMLYPCRKQCPLILWFHAVSMQEMMSIKF